MSEPHGLPGVLAGVGPARHSDLNAFRQGRLRLVRLRAQVNPIGDLAKWRDAGAAEADTLEHPVNESCVRLEGEILTVRVPAFGITTVKVGG